MDYIKNYGALCKAEGAFEAKLNPMTESALSFKQEICKADVAMALTFGFTFDKVQQKEEKGV